MDARYPVPVRYDLGQVFCNEVSLRAALRTMGDGLWYASAARLPQIVRQRRARRPTSPCSR